MDIWMNSEHPWVIINACIKCLSPRSNIPGLTIFCLHFCLIFKYIFLQATNILNDNTVTDCHHHNNFHTYIRYDMNLTLSQTNPGFYVSAVQVF